MLITTSLKCLRWQGIKKISPKDALDRLNKIMQEAGQDLIDEKITQESFRTFTEAYKTVRDAIA